MTLNSFIKNSVLTSFLLSTPAWSGSPEEAARQEARNTREQTYREKDARSEGAFWRQVRGEKKRCEPTLAPSSAPSFWSWVRSFMANKTSATATTTGKACSSFENPLYDPGAAYPDGS